jgi:hypothetical protein
MLITASSFVSGKQHEIVLNMHEQWCEEIIFIMSSLQDFLISNKNVDI